MRPTSLRVIGPGRAGTSLARALADGGWRVLPPLGRGDDVGTAAMGVDLLVIATPDAAVAEVAAAVEPVETTVVAHLAGSLGLDVLAPHRRRASIHPLVPLPDADTGARRLRDGAWFVTAGDDLATCVVQDLGGHSLHVADADRAAYHAAACIASNHLVALLGQAERVAGGVNVPLEALLDLVRSTVDNVATLGPAAALTGPVARGDWATVERHLAALDPAERPAYEAMAAAAHHLSRSCRDRAPSDRRERGKVAVVDRVDTFRKELEAARAAGRTVGLVPTMGYLHEGHASLIRRAAAECDVVAVSVFVNPLQFGPTEDLAAYPRDLDRDVELADACGAQLVFAPSTEEMYPEPLATTVSVAGVAEGFEGALRPTHFAGVATVVAKLFAMAGPCRAYFGEKDFQQLAVIRRLVHDLSFPVEVVGCATVREPDGLAMSSRNVYLTDEERVAATVLDRALTEGVELVERGERDPAIVRGKMRAAIEAEPRAELDYAEIVRARDLSVPDSLSGELRLLVAARFGRARLIDNRGVVI